MPQVPYQPIPSERPSQQGTPHVNVPLSPDSFGVNVAQAVEQVGGAISHSGDELWQRAIALQQLRNETEAREADAQYMVKAGELHANFSALQGKEAVDAFPKYQKDLDDTRKSIRSGLATDQSRKMYDSSALSVMGRTIFNGAGHAATQNKQWANQASTARVDMIQNGIYNTPDDDVGYRRATNTIESEVETQGDIQGWPSERVEMEKKKHVSGALAMRIAGMAKNEPFKANELYEKNKDKLYGPDVKRTEDIVRTGMYTAGSRGISDKVNADLYSGDAEGRPEIGLQQRIKDGMQLADQQMPRDPMFKDYVRERITSDYNKHKSAIRDENEESRFTVADALQPKPGQAAPTNLDELLVDDKTKAAYDKLKPPQRAGILKALANNAKGDFAETPDTRNRFYELLGMAQSDPAEFLNQNIQAEEIPNRWKDQLYKTQLQVKKGAAGDPRVGQALRVMEPILEPLGITAGKDRTRYQQFRGAMQLAIEQFIDENKKGPKPEEVRQIGARLLQEVKSPGSVFGDLWPDKTQLFEMQAPKDILEKVKADAEARGAAPPTDAQIHQEYVRRRYNELIKRPQGKPPQMGPQ